VPWFSNRCPWRYSRGSWCFKLSLLTNLLMAITKSNAKYYIMYCSNGNSCFDERYCKLFLRKIWRILLPFIITTIITADYLTVITSSLGHDIYTAWHLHSIFVKLGKHCNFPKFRLLGVFPVSKILYCKKNLVFGACQSELTAMKLQALYNR